MPVTLLNNDADISKLIRLAGTQSAKFAETAHNAAYNAIAACDRTGDIRHMQALLDAVPARAKVAIAAYAVQFGKFRYNPKEHKFGFAKSGTTDLAGAEAIGPMEWIKPKADPVKHAFDLKAEIQKLITKANKRNINGPAVVLLTSAAAKA